MRDARIQLNLSRILFTPVLSPSEKIPPASIVWSKVPAELLNRKLALFDVTRKCPRDYAFS